MNGRGRVLVVDDTEANRDLLCRRLARRGYDTAPAASGGEALERVAQGAPDLVLLDLRMPDLNGFEVLQRLRQDHPLTELAVIMVTAEGQSQDVVRAFELGANDYVTKPIDFPVLLARMETQLARQEAQQKLKLAQEELAQLALYDALTGLYNRHYLDQLLAQELERAQRYGHPLTLLLIDLDGFKQVNDRLGHLKGDEVLRAVGRLIQGTLRKSDSAFRYGGDEFLALLVETNGTAVHAIERMKANFQRWLEGGKIGLPLDLSVGRITWKPGMEADPEALLRQADRQLYAEKQDKQVDHLRRQVRLQAEFLDNVSELIVAVDLEGRLISANQSFLRWVGCASPPARPEGVRLARRVPELAPLLEQVGRGDLSPSCLERPDPDGRVQSVYFTPSTLKNARGTPYGTVLIGTDVTALERASRQLRQTQRRLLQAFQLGQELAQLDAVEVVAQHAARWATQHYGYDLAGVALVEGDRQVVAASVGSPAAQLKVGQRLPGGQSLVSWAIERRQTVRVNDVRGDPRYCELDPQTRSELVVPIALGQKVLGALNLESYRLNAFSEEDCELASFLAGQLAVAISNLWREQALQQAQGRYQSLFEGAPDGITLLDARGNHVEVNAKMLELVGYSREEFLRKGFRQLIAPEDQEDSARRLAQMAQGRWSSEPYQKHAVHKDGTPIPVEFTVAPVFDEQGRLQYVISIARDLREKERLLEAEREQRLLAETLHEAALALNAQRTSQRVLEEILRQAWRLVPYTAANITLIEGESLKVRGSHGYGALGLKSYIDRLEQDLNDFSLDQEVLQTRQPVVVSDARQDPRWVFVERMAWIRSFLSVPLCLEGRVLGMLRLDADRPGQFDEGAAARLKSLANLAAIALEHARLHEQAEQELAERQRVQASLARQNEVLQLTNEGRHLPEVLEALIELIESECPGMVGSILLLDEAGTRLRHGAAPHLPEEYNRRVDGLKIGPQAGSCGTAAFRGEPVVVSDVEADPLWEGYRKLAREHGLRACWSTPIFSGTGELLGTFALYYPLPRSPTEEEVQCIEEASCLAGIAIERDRSQRQERQLQRELEKTAIETATVLSQVIEEKDRYTGEHCQRLAERATTLGRQLGLTSAQLEQLRYAALLHDVGKVGVPEGILNKPGPLTEEERARMEDHVRVGAELVRGIVPLRRAARIIVQHHERWDGSGYPQGLRGEEILLEARILAVVDAYDALRSDRPYRRPWSKKEALKYVEEQAGRHFDPAVVKVFLHLLPEL